MKSGFNQVTIFEADHSVCSEEMMEEIRLLWQDQGFGNDNYYYKWSSKWAQEEGGDAERYPLLAAHIKAEGVEDCLIHWWW